MIDRLRVCVPASYLSIVGDAGAPECLTQIECCGCTRQMSVVRDVVDGTAVDIFPSAELTPLERSR